MTWTIALGALLGMTLHEFAHAAVADLEGDPTARILGRVTANPLPHLDPLGSLLMPALTFMTLGLPFGWMRPVPVSAGLLRSRWSRVRLLAAGPAMNLLVAGAFMVSGVPDAAAANLALGLFNLLPLAPLDGGEILQEILTWR